MFIDCRLGWAGTPCPRPRRRWASPARPWGRGRGRRPSGPSCRCLWRGSSPVTHNVVVFNCLRKNTKFFRIKTQITSFFTNITYYIIQISAKNMQNHVYLNKSPPSYKSFSYLCRLNKCMSGDSVPWHIFRLLNMIRRTDPVIPQIILPTFFVTLAWWNCEVI